MKGKDTKDIVKVKMAEETPGSDSQFNLDGILAELGSFGKYQLLLLLLLAFRDSFLAMCNFNYVFAAADVAYRCEVPECEYSDSSFNATWSSYALYNNSKTCHRMAPYGDSTNESCSPLMFDEHRTVRCERVIYENYNSIVAEFDLGCQPWKRTLIGTVHNLGQIFSYILSGFISDRYGRKVVIVATPLVVGSVGLLKSFSINYWMLLVLEFLETALGYGNASMVLSLETVSQQSRVIFSCISDSLSTFGAAFFGLIAWKIPYWRYMMRAIYAPLLVVVFYIFLVDEGVRWLLAHNKKDEAVRILNKVAKVNNITLSNKAKEMLQRITEERSKADQAGCPAPPERPQVLAALRSRKILQRVALVASLFFCTTFVYHGTIVNSTSLSGNKYINFSALLLVSVPTRIVTAITLTKFGRKAPLCVAYCLCAVLFISSAFVPVSVWGLSLTLYLLGKMCSDYGMFGASVVALEVFPTGARNSLANLALTLARAGAALAPQAPLLEEFMAGLPSVVFGLAALGPAALCLLLPDTSRAALPDHLADAENLDEESETERTETPAV